MERDYIQFKIVVLILNFWIIWFDLLRWPVPSKLLVSPLEERLPGSNSLPRCVIFFALDMKILALILVIIGNLNCNVFLIHRLPVSLHPPPVVSRSPIVTALVLLLFGESLSSSLMYKKFASFVVMFVCLICVCQNVTVKSVSIRRVLSSWSGSCPSRGLFVRLLRTSR